MTTTTRRERQAAEAREAKARANLRREADAEIKRAIEAEFAAPSADARRMIRNERMAIQVRMQRNATADDVRDAIRECVRVRDMWDGL